MSYIKIPNADFSANAIEKISIDLSNNIVWKRVGENGLWGYFDNEKSYSVIRAAASPMNEVGYVDVRAYRGKYITIKVAQIARQEGLDWDWNLFSPNANMLAIDTYTSPIYDQIQSCGSFNVIEDIGNDYMVGVKTVKIPTNANFLVVCNNINYLPQVEMSIVVTDEDE